jgi:hypothetical protein
MDDPDFVNVFFEACAEILVHHRRQLLGVESVEVEDPVYRDMDYVIIILCQIRSLRKEYDWGTGVMEYWSNKLSGRVDRNDLLLAKFVCRAFILSIPIFHHSNSYKGII